MTQVPDCGVKSRAAQPADENRLIPKAVVNVKRCRLTVMLAMVSPLVETGSSAAFDCRPRDHVMGCFGSMADLDTVQQNFEFRAALRAKRPEDFYRVIANNTWQWQLKLDGITLDPSTVSACDFVLGARYTRSQVFTGLMYARAVIGQKRTLRYGGKTW